MTTLQELVDDTRSHLDESQPQFYEPQELVRWIWEGLRDVARRAEVLQAHRSYTIEANRLTYPAPEDALRLYRVEYRQSSSQIWMLDYVPLNELDAYSGQSREIPGSIPQLWSFWGTMGGPNSQIYLFPAPSSTIADGMRVYYYRLPIRPDAGDMDAPVDIPVGWEDLIPLYVEQVALRKARDPRYQEAAALYEARLGQMIDLTRHATDQTPGHFQAQSWASRWSWAGSGWYD